MKWFLWLAASWSALSQQGPETLWIQGRFADSKLSLDRARIRSGYAPPSLDVTDADIFTGLNVWSALALVESADIYDATGAHEEAQRRYGESLTVLDRFLGAETPAVQSVRARIRRGP